MECLCQRVYDTGFTGIPRVDRRLRHQYEVYGEDCIHRAYDHANLHVPYTDSPRNPYCFVTKTKGACAHESCEHARYRPPDTVRKMRWYIEHELCKAHVHYPDLLNQIDRSGDTRPEMDNEVARTLQWDERQYQLHKSLGYRERQPRLTVTSPEQFREELTTALTGISLDAGTIAAAELEATFEELRDVLVDGMLDANPQMLAIEALDAAEELMYEAA